MPITQQEIDTIKQIILDGAKTHFPPPVQFLDANVTVRLNHEEEEFFDVQLLYTAPNPVLDGHLMITFFRVTDEPIRAAGITARALVTLHRYQRPHQVAIPQVANSVITRVMIDPNELIATCYKLVPQSADPPPSEADLRRAVSAAYYAVFHTLAASNAELIAGQPQSGISAYAWERVYRRLDHGRAQNNLRAVLNLLSPAGENFARAFIELQDLRREADYDPNFSITVRTTSTPLPRPRPPSVTSPN